MQIICHLGWIFNRPLHAGSVLVKRAEDKENAHLTKPVSFGRGRAPGRMVFLRGRCNGVAGCGLPAPACGHSALSAAAAPSTAPLEHTSVLSGHHPSFGAAIHVSSTHIVARQSVLRPRGLGDSLANALVWMDLLHSTYLILCLQFQDGEKNI